MDSSSPIIKQYDYRPRKWQVVALFLLALAGTALLACFAIFLDRPVDARGLKLNPLQARILFGVFAALSPIGLFCIGATAYVAFAYNRRVALTKTHLILPKPTRMGLSRDEINIPLDAIASVSVRKFIGATELLCLDYADGIVSIPSNMFQNRGEFDDLCQAVRAAVDHVGTEASKTTDYSSGANKFKP